MDLLTSYKGKAHLTSMQFRALIESICGSESRIANLDEKMILELAENNTVKIRSGILIHHGAVMQVKRGTYDPITYQNGSQGMKRIDLIVAKYSKSADTKIEDAEWEIIQGEASDSDPVVPTFTEGDMQDGDLIDRCAFAELHFDGINVTEVKQLVPVARNTEELEAELDELNRKTEILNKTDQTPGSALKYRDATELGYTNLTFGYWEKGIYLYPGYLDGAPNDFSGLLLVFTDGSSFMKYAFAFDGNIYSMRQKVSDGTISVGWTKI